MPGAGLIVLLAWMGAAAGAAAADTGAEELMRQGLILMSEEKYADAVDKLREATTADPDLAQAWGNLGLALDLAGRYEEAVQAYLAVLRFEEIAPIARYNLACTYSMMNDRDQAFHWLYAVLEDGFRNVERLRTDTDLDNIRDDPRFQDVLVKAGAHPRPCESDERYRQLDFWLGRWEVRDSGGTLVGHNFVVPMLKGCLILENWLGQGESGEGKSLNYLDPRTGKWRQNWVADRGYTIDYTGEIREGVLHLEGTNTSVDGSVERSRMTLTPGDDGTVHQLIEQSKDDGATWYVWFDGTYTPMKEPPPDKAGAATGQDRPSN